MSVGYTMSTVRLLLGGDFEGDILLVSDTFYRGIGARDSFARWPNGVVPYVISPDYGENTFLKPHHSLSHSYC
jgi:hypothetical protein